MTSIITFKCSLIGLFLSLIALPVLAENFTSKYVGEENRNIKSLSADDIEELKQGGGWGLAKAAELNGVPGPAHILEMADQIQLSVQQKNKIESIFQKMNKQAVALGYKLIQLESELNNAFAENNINQNFLEKSIHAIENVRAQLRLVHLSTHLQTPNILSKEQIRTYNKLRGYESDPCLNIPAGHNAKMWKKHNGCE